MMIRMELRAPFIPGNGCCGCGAIDSFLRAGEASGTIRKGVDAEDLLLLMGFLWRIEPGPTGKARAERLLSLVLDALKA
jgi:hypothetical protein